MSSSISTAVTSIAGNHDFAHLGGADLEDIVKHLLLFIRHAGFAGAGDHRLDFLFAQAVGEGADAGIQADDPDNPVGHPGCQPGKRRQEARLRI